ncbi:MAG: endonuclease MutS2 [Methanosarcinaceae archaeon]|nr:endonuclease MutS2 [Methanosarcinaceae archaeon]
MNELQEIPRIGEKMAQRFITHFGSEECALDAILGGDVASISGVEGVGQRYAISLVHEVRAKVEGVTSSDFLRTKEAMDLYERLLDLMKDFAHSRYAKDKLHVYIPYPAERMDLIDNIRASVSDYIGIASKLHDDDEFIFLLTRLRRLDKSYVLSKIRHRCILTTDSEQFEEARRRFSNVIDVQLASSLGEFVDVARGYSHVIATGDQCIDFELPEDIDPEFIPDIQTVEDWHVVPELEIAFFARNLEVIECALKIVSTLRTNSVSFMEDISDEDLDILTKTLSLIDGDGDVQQGFDPAIDRLSHIIENTDKCVADIVRDTNIKLDVLLQESKLTLSGQDMLRMMDGKVQVQDLISKELYHSYHSLINTSMDEISANLGLKGSETLLIGSFFPDEITSPLEIDHNQLHTLKQQMMHKIHMMKIGHKRKISTILSDYHDVVIKLISEVLDFDVGFAIGCFANEFDMSLPNLISGTGIGFVNARNLFIRSRHGNVVPIDYSVGGTSLAPNGADNPVVLLSGVNSGGKTSMLELIAQCIILAHMGFPTPAEHLELGLTEGLYYFGKSKGTLDAGAFETTLTDLSVVADGASKVVLVDELESITEPGASAKIIAGMLEFLSESNDSMAVFVSHLSELILENTQCNIRVDGIEADGLDEELNLIVDRNPRYNYVAKSTPELIVQRLSQKTSGNEQTFYKRLGEKFH